MELAARPRGCARSVSRIRVAKGTASRQLVQLFLQVRKFSMNGRYCALHFRIYIRRTLARFLCAIADLLEVVYPLAHAIFVF
jgi:hypothetical protein